MTLLERFIKRVQKQKLATGVTDPANAYNLWSESYDAQPDNLMLALDEQIFSGLLSDVTIAGKTVVDIGCGTGRNWKKILLQQPRSLEGYDVSIGMLTRLREKFPEAMIHRMQNNFLPQLEDESRDIIVSTLTLAHIEDIDEALLEWCRVLKNEGDLIITDYHPDAFVNGGDRTFSHYGQTVAIKNYIHPIDEVSKLLQGMGFVLMSFTEKKIDRSMRHFYEEKNALAIYEKFKDVSIIYGMHLKKKNALM